MNNAYIYIYVFRPLQMDGMCFGVVLLLFNNAISSINCKIDTPKTLQHSRIYFRFWGKPRGPPETYCLESHWQEFPMDVCCNIITKIDNMTFQMAPGYHFPTMLSQIVKHHSNYFPDSPPTEVSPSIC